MISTRHIIPLNVNLLSYDAKQHELKYYDSELIDCEYAEKLININFEIILYGQNVQDPRKKTLTGGISDCGENTIFNIINYLIYNIETNKFNIDWLPEHTIDKIKSFYIKYDSFSKFNKDAYIEFDLILQNFQFTYQKFDLYNTIAYNHILLNKEYIINENREKAELYIIYDDNGCVIPGQKEIIYTGYELKPGLLTIIRIFNIIFGYNKKSDKYNENNILKHLTYGSFEEIIRTFRNERIKQFEFKVDTLSNTPLNGDVTIIFDKIKVMLTYNHASYESLVMNTGYNELMSKLEIQSIIYQKLKYFDLFDDAIMYIYILLNNNNVINQFIKKIFYNKKGLKFDFNIENIKLISDYINMNHTNLNFTLRRIPNSDNKLKLLSLINSDNYNISNNALIRINEMTDYKYIKFYIDYIKDINKDLIEGIRLIKYIILSGSFDNFKKFLSEPGLNLLLLDNKGNNILHYISSEKLGKSYVNKIIDYLKDNNCEVFDQLKATCNKQMVFPSHYSFDIDIAYKLLSENDVAIIQFLIKYLRETTNFELEKIYLLNKIYDEDKRRKCCYYLIDILVRNKVIQEDIFNIIFHYIEVKTVEYIKFFYLKYPRLDFVQNDILNYINEINSFEYINPWKFISNVEFIKCVEKFIKIINKSDSSESDIESDSEISESNSESESDSESESSDSDDSDDSYKERRIKRKMEMEKQLKSLGLDKRESRRERNKIREIKREEKKERESEESEENNFIKAFIRIFQLRDIEFSDSLISIKETFDGKQSGNKNLTKLILDYQSYFKDKAIDNNNNSIFHHLAIGFLSDPSNIHNICDDDKYEKSINNDLYEKIFSMMIKRTSILSNLNSQRNKGGFKIIDILSNVPNYNYEYTNKIISDLYYIKIDIIFKILNSYYDIILELIKNEDLKLYIYNDIKDEHIILTINFLYPIYKRYTKACRLFNTINNIITEMKSIESTIDTKEKFDYKFKTVNLYKYNNINDLIISESIMNKRDTYLKRYFSEKSGYNKEDHPCNIKINNDKYDIDFFKKKSYNYWFYNNDLIFIKEHIDKDYIQIDRYNELLPEDDELLPEYDDLSPEDDEINFKKYLKYKYKYIKLKQN
jgi:hypothetical protein